MNIDHSDPNWYHHQADQAEQAGRRHQQAEVALRRTHRG
jgi:hypothetical protein